MKSTHQIARFFGILFSGVLLFDCAFGAEPMSLREARLLGAKNSKYLKPLPAFSADKAPAADLETFHNKIKPLLEQACTQCHGGDKQKGDFRIDTLDPDLLSGKDVDWWLEVVDVISNGEMPPADDEVELSDAGRSKMIDWLTREIQVASQVRRTEKGYTTFRRLTRYEYNYALQDLLGLPYEFASDLPPEAASEDGFKNSSEMLQMSAMQFEQYRELGRRALQKATVKGEKPQEMYFSINLAEKANKLYIEKQKPNPSDKERKKFSKVNTAAPHYFNFKTGEALSGIRINLRDRPHASIESLPDAPELLSLGMVLPGKGKVAFNLGSELPERGNLKVRVRAARLSEDGSPPRFRLHYGFQASNNSHGTVKLSERDLEVKPEFGKPRFYQWLVPLSEINRNPFRGKKIAKVNSTESIILENTNPNTDSKAFIDYAEVTTPAYEQWPPESHTRLFPDSDNLDAHEIVSNFMKAAWRRNVPREEVDQKLAYYKKLQPAFEDPQDALIEVMTNILASPNFLYVVRSPEPDSFEIATRLSLFLWSSVPDDELLALAREGKLNSEGELKQQVSRMLKDPRSQRFSKHFVRQWLGMELLDYLNVDKEIYKQFNTELKRSMQEEPIAFFEEVLSHNQSILDFLHADFGMVNETLGMHYQISDQSLGSDFQRIALDEDQRGGLLTQAGLLAMNSDGKDSHPLKRGIWLLEKILNDPPPPPPPSVPEIDLADPKIAKMTLKERMEDHRNDAACMSCHARIDPWGIAFENFDAVGSWRKEIDKKPVDAGATLFNGEELNGIEGLKRYLLLNRQDQFARAMVHKMVSYALGRPMSFEDYAKLEEITSQLRKDGDGLASLISLIVTNDLFRKN